MITNTETFAPLHSTGNTYANDANGNQITRTIGADSFNLLYDAENQLVEVKKNSSTIASFIYDGDGKRVKSVMGAETTLFVGNYFEQKGSEVTKYYPSGAMRRYTIPQNMTLEYVLGDHLGSASITTDSNGIKTSELRYKPWGEIRYSWVKPDLNTTPAYKLPDYTFTGQRSYMDDPSTSASEGFGLMFYNARWYDGQLGRFTQADSIVPGGVQGLDRYAAMFNNPIMYIDPSGHNPECGPDGIYCSKNGFSEEEILDQRIADFGLVLDGDMDGWTYERKKTVYSAIVLVGNRFAETRHKSETATQAFHAVYGKIFTFTWSNSQPGNAGFTNDYNHITLYSVQNSPNYLANHSRVIVHELGHAFNIVTDREAEDSLGADLLRDADGDHIDESGRYYGFAGGWDNWQFGWDNTQSEVFADMFVGWAYHAWDFYHPNDLGIQRNTHMNINMPNWLNR